MIETLLLLFFGALALASAALMLVLRHPMRVALALITTMLCLGAIYGLLGVHAIAVFQVLIYVGAVMVFMIYAIMLLDLRDPAFKERYSAWLLPGVVAAVLLFVTIAYVMLPEGTGPTPALTKDMFDVRHFSAAFLADYWLHFELISVLLVAAVVAALAVIMGKRSNRG
ncbi:MAG TPA: NADH-quinone oxidoreductase subunit J [Casimicrobiaceae bacterium]|nr:NADH-quinone oxidoreductase subunit J [Casimicrobiaceae bacterium]